MQRFTQTVQKGSAGPEVMHLQRFLETYGYGDFVPTGFYGDKTTAAVAKLQTDRGIDTSSGAYAGVFGPATRAVANGMISDSARLLLLQTAKSMIGKDASPADLAPDEYGCAETACDVMNDAGVGIPVILSTYQLYQAMLGRPDFVKTDQPLPGDLIISPTGYGSGALPNGHVGFVGDNGVVMSNSSADGTFKQNYTLDTWKARYQGLGGYPIFYFRRIS